MIGNQIPDSILPNVERKKCPSSCNAEVGRKRLCVASGMEFGENGKRNMDVV